jgi:cytochrome c oxidase cbb3-type subunit 3
MPSCGRASGRRMAVFLVFGTGVAFFLGFPTRSAKPQDAPPAQAVPQTTARDPVAIERGQKQFQQSCAFCHATGARGPDIVRSSLLAHDVKGDLLGKVIHEGRPDKGMPPQPLTDQQVLDIATFLHAREAEAKESSQVPKGYAVENLLTGNVEAGKAYFDGAGGCKSCHSPMSDLAGIAGKYSAVDLQSRMLYPRGHHKYAVVTLPSGERVWGPVAHLDDFEIALHDTFRNYRSFPRDRVKLELIDGVAAHRELLDKIKPAEIHNLFAYLQTLK